MRCIFKRQHATLAAVNGRLMVDVDVASIRDFKNSIRPSFSNGRNHGSISQDDRSFTFGIKESDVSKFSSFKSFTLSFTGKSAVVEFHSTSSIGGIDLRCSPDRQIIVKRAILERGIPVTDIHCARDQASVLLK